MRNPVYSGNSRWTANRKQKKKDALAESAKGAKAVTSYFSVSQMPNENQFKKG